MHPIVGLILLSNLAKFDQKYDTRAEKSALIVGSNPVATCGEAVYFVSRPEALVTFSTVDMEERDRCMTRVSYWVVMFGWVLLGGCSRIYPPAAFIDRIAPIYPDARPQNCNVELLTSKPTEPYEVFAQIVCYAGSAEMAEGMLSLIKANACELGADAIVVLPLQHREHLDSMDVYPDWVLESTERFGHSQDKRYSVSQKAAALIYKKNISSRKAEPAS